MLESALKLQTPANDAAPSAWYMSAMEHLVEVVQALSHAHSVDAIMTITRDAARALTGADGATFVLRDGDQCYYADESAISPLWKGCRFPMKACISGWVMTHAEPAIIEDVYADDRIPVVAYKPTFVKSLAMVPIRRNSPIGAIGNYWATKRQPTDEEIALLQALADTTSVAMENVALYQKLHHKVEALQETNEELSRFAWVASHDLQEPLRTITTHVELLSRRHKHELSEQARGYVEMAAESAQRLQTLIQDLLVHGRIEAAQHFQPVNMENIADAVIRDMQAAIVDAHAVVTHINLPEVRGDATLLRSVLQNLVSNAIKFRKPHTTPTIHIGCRREGNHWRFFVEDNGLGIAENYHERIFDLFQRLHPQSDYAGSGIGLASCKKIIELHGGRIWVESSPGNGSVFCFTLPIVLNQGDDHA